MIDYRKFSLHSDFNYLKRDPNLVGSALITLGAYGTYADHIVEHNFGYVPVVLVFTDIDNTGTVWMNSKVELGTYINFDLAYPILDYDVDEQRLRIRLYNETSPIASGTRRVWWVIYKEAVNA